MAAKECPLKLFREEGEEWTLHFCSNGEQMCRFVVKIFFIIEKKTKTDKITNSIAPMFCLTGGIFNPISVTTVTVLKFIICNNVCLNLRKKRGVSGMRKLDTDEENGWY